MQENETIWNNTVEEITAGYQKTEEAYICVFCRKKYQEGTIYSEEGALFDAYGAVKNHVMLVHGYTVDYLLGQNPDIIGISEIQQNTLQMMSDGMEDKMIAKELGIAPSTVRNHRYKLREKRKQAKLFTALMASLEQKTQKPISQTDLGSIEELHVTASMMDERYNITEGEREKTIRAYMDENGHIKQFPAKEKKKIILLREVMKCFSAEREYQEKEINRILERIYEDYAAVRRALIDYKFLSRSMDGAVYRVISKDGVQVDI